MWYVSERIAQREFAFLRTITAQGVVWKHASLISREEPNFASVNLLLWALGTIYSAGAALAVHDVLWQQTGARERARRAFTSVRFLDSLQALLASKAAALSVDPDAADTVQINMPRASSRAAFIRAQEELSTMKKQALVHSKKQSARVEMLSLSARVLRFLNETPRRVTELVVVSSAVLPSADGMLLTFLMLHNRASASLRQPACTARRSSFSTSSPSY